MSALKLKKGASSKSAYNLRPTFSDVIERHTLAVVVENEPGVLARVIGLFSGRGYNIESLTVAAIDHQGHLSRITIVTAGISECGLSKARVCLYAVCNPWRRWQHG